MPDPCFPCFIWSRSGVGNSFNRNRNPLTDADADADADAGESTMRKWQ